MKILKTLYATVNDVDLHVGSLLEIPEEGSIIGPTTRCILSDSFFRYKYGDRFFYDVQGQPGSFTQGTYILLIVKRLYFYTKLIIKTLSFKLILLIFRPTKNNKTN